MNLNTENLAFGITLGFKLARMEFIWGSDFEFAKKEFENAKNEIYSLIVFDNIIPNESSYQSFSSSILNYYMRANIEIFYSILIGICIQRSLLIGASKSESSNKEIELLAKSSLKSIPDDIILDKEKFFEFIKNKKSSSFDLSEVAQEINNYLKEQQLPKQETHISKNDGYVFISYSSKNQTYAEATRSLLKQEQINSWMAPYDIPAGSKYAYVINDAIQNCSCVLLLLTEEAQESEFVEREIERAVSYKKSIISMHLDESKLNSGFRYFLGSEQIVPVKSIDKTSDDIKKILNGIRAFCTNYISNSDASNVIKTKSELSKFIRTVRYDDISAIIDDISDPKQFISMHYPPDTTKGLYAYLNSAITQVEISDDVTTKLFLEGCLLGIILIREIFNNSESKQLIDSIINSINYDYFSKQLTVEQNKMWKERILVYDGLYMIAMSKSNEYNKNGNVHAGTVWASVYLILAIIDSFLQE